MSGLTMEQLLAAARSRIREVSVEELRAGVEKNAVIIDVREPEEHASGHIPGSINLP